MGSPRQWPLMVAIRISETKMAFPKLAGDKYKFIAMPARAAFYGRSRVISLSIYWRISCKNCFHSRAALH